MAEDKKLTQLIINELTKAQYEALGDNVNEDEIYVITDDEVEIKSDGATIVGNGTTATPLAISPEFIDKVNTEIADRTEAITELQEAIQDLEDTKVEKSSLGIASGVATLDANAKVPLSQINDSLIGNVNYQGLYDASTNTPNLDTVAPKGHYYITSVKGTAQGIDFEVGDWIISNGTSWDKVDNTDAVSSVNGRTGNVVITKEDIDLSEYAKFTDYATTEKSGTIKTVDSFATDVDGSGFLYAKSKTADNYNTSSDNIFISKGTLENIKSDYVKAGVVSNSNTLTTEEQTNAQNWLGAASKTELQNAVNNLNESIESVTETSEATYVKKAGDTMTGALKIERTLDGDNKYGSAPVITLSTKSADGSVQDETSISFSSTGVLSFDSLSVIGVSEILPQPSSLRKLGARTAKWETTYTQKIDNGAPLIVPSIGGTLARIEDIPHVETLPEATAENVNKILQYVGETSDTATQGYFYKNVGTESVEWSGMLMLNTSTQADATITVDSSKLLAQDPVYAGNGTCVISYSDSGWTNWDETFEGETKPVSSLEDWGITVTMNDGSTYVPQSGDYVRVISTAVTAYGWEQIAVQESFPDQTNNAGKFLTTDGTSVSWSDKPLVNKSSKSNSFSLSDSYDDYGNSYCVIGANASVSGGYSIAYGYSSKANTYGVALGVFANSSLGIAIGYGSKNTNISVSGISIGHKAQTTATGAIQLGGKEQTNSDPNTFKVGNENGNFEMMSADGTIPTERLASDGTVGQVLKKAESGMVWSDLLAEHVNITIGSETTTVKSAIETINSKIPEAASSTNLLVDKATLDNAINSFEALPDKTNNNGKVLATDGTDAYWTDAFVKPTDYATDSKAGISKVNAANGIAINSSNTLAISQATVADIETKTNQYNPITPAMLDYAVKAGILANSMQLSAEEKLVAQNWLGFGTITMRTWK